MRSVLFALSLAAMMCAVITIMVRYALPQRPGLFYTFKPLTTCLILAVAVIPGAHAWSNYVAGIVFGLLFSLAGDIWLMLPADRFVPGLASFTLAHLSYSFAFATRVRYTGFPWLAITLALVGALMLWYLWPALVPRLRVPVSAYVFVVVAMASLAVYRASTVPSAGALSAAIGAVLFLSSDGVLATDRFRRPFPLAQAIVLGTYFAGQLLISLSVGL